MDVVRMLTLRFRAQDISAKQDSSSKTSALQTKEEAHDSGTGSDEELMAHVSNQSRSSERTNASENQQHSSVQVYDNPDADRSRDSCRQVSTSLGLSPVLLSPVDFHCLVAAEGNDDFSALCSAERHSPTGSEFERSVLVASSSLSDLGVECSSGGGGGGSGHEGEDPMTINRKRPPMSDDSCIFSEDDDEDNDDDDVEICELFGDDYGDDEDEDDDDDDVLGSRRRCRRKNVVPLGSSTSSPTILSTIPFSGRGASPQKRCRHDAEGTKTLRPNLDFYKMQKTSFVRRHCGINRPRPAKLMVFNGSQGQKSNAAFGPSSFTFRSLEFN